MNVTSEVSLADLATALAELRPGGEGWRDVARALGLQQSDASMPEKPARTLLIGTHAGTPAETEPEGETYRQTARDTTPVVRIPEALLNRPALPFSIGQAPARVPPLVPLIPQRQLRAFVHSTVAHPVPTAAIDVDALARQLARLRLTRPLPRKTRPGLRRGVSVVFDDGEGMQPFRQDAAQYGYAFRRLAASHVRDEFSVVGSPLDPLAGDIDRLPKSAPAHGASVVLLTDFGAARPWSARRARPADWVALAKRLAKGGYRVVAVVPYGPRRRPKGTPAMNIVYWHSGRASAVSYGAEGVHALCRSLSLAGRIDPALIREARRSFFPDAEAGLEADCIFSSYVAIANPHIVAFHDDSLRELRAELAADPSELERAREFLKAYRQRYGADELLLFEEELVYCALRRTPFDEAFVRDGIASALRTVVERPEDRGLARWATSFLREVPDWVRELPEGGALRDVARVRLGSGSVEVVREGAGRAPAGMRVEVGAEGFTRAGSLRGEQVQAIVDVLVNRGGFALIPSDTCYSLAARPTDTSMPRRINQILQRKEEPISLAFDSVTRVGDWVALDRIAARLFEHLTPGPLTVVCPIAEGVNASITAKVLAANDGTIGVRIPDSRVETQLVTACDSPLTTVAVRTLDQAKTPVTDFEQARRIVEQGIASLSEPVALALVEARQPFFSTHSTVVRVPPRSDGVAYDLLRQGALSPAELDEAIGRVSRWELQNPRETPAMTVDRVRDLASRIVGDVRATIQDKSAVRRVMSELGPNPTPGMLALTAATLETIRKSVEGRSHRAPRR